MTTKLLLQSGLLNMTRANHHPEFPLSLGHCRPDGEKGDRLGRKLGSKSLCWLGREMSGQVRQGGKQLSRL